MEFVSFEHEAARFRISREALRPAAAAIRENRAALERYIARHERFRASLVPVELLPGAPPIALVMSRASLAAGVGPMAAVAGAFAEIAGRAALGEGIAEAVVENGGDIFVKVDAPITVGLYAGSSPLSGRLAFRIDPERTPLGICSSSGTLGHSLSLGACDLATVVSADTALADAVATLAANLVSRPEDIDRALAAAGDIPGVLGVLIVKGDRIGMRGDLPPLVRNGDPRFLDKITRDPFSGYVF
ncbi:MAG: UPF0280 family protein [Spirochaetes bacterium]|nr:UPF0280 family protein [Spirochaetota bacterium]MBU1080010.1 UPF0280 family protein [Spirochaetota bacterium]